MQSSLVAKQAMHIAATRALQSLYFTLVQPALVANTGTFISIWRVSLRGALNAESTLRPLEDALKRKYSIKVSKGEKRGEMK
jgi:hypothetical protein